MSPKSIAGALGTRFVVPEQYELQRRRGIALL